MASYADSFVEWRRKNHRMPKISELRDLYVHHFNAYWNYQGFWEYVTIDFEDGSFWIKNEIEGYDPESEKATEGRKR